MPLRHCLVLCSLLLVLKAGAEVPSVEPLLRPFVERGELAGAVALTVNSKGETQVACVGHADREAKRPMGPDTLFWIASQTKSITAVAVMMLVDEEKLSLDDPVAEHLPEFANQKLVAETTEDRVVLVAPSRPVTLRDCLDHLSGMGFKSAAEDPSLDGLPLAAAVKTYAMTPLLGEPGTTYRYSNSGINTAARVLEVVSRMPYEAFLQKRLFDPLKMKDTTFWPTEEQLSRLAKSYRPNSGKTELEAFETGFLLHPLDDRTRRYAMPAGGLFSTALDLAQFCRMLLGRGELDGKRYLSDAAFSELTRRQTPDSATESYGLGFFVSPDGFGHGGAHSTEMAIRPARDLALVWMVQHSGFLGDGAKAKGLFFDRALKGAPPR